MLAILPSWLVVLFTAALPVFELRGAIPLAMGVYDYGPAQAYLISVIGNLLPVIPLLLFLGPVSDWLRRFSIFDRFFTWLFARTRRKYIKDREGFGLAALAVFVAIPLPVTGAWTGCAIAFLVGFKFWPAFISITVGVLIAGIIVTAAMLGILQLFI